MKVVLTVVRYPAWLAWAGFLSMALFRLPLMFNKKISFFKLLGSGKNGTFDVVPDLKQWGIMVILKPGNAVEITPGIATSAYGKFITGWYSFFRAKRWTIVLDPIEGHGLWDGREVFGKLPRNTEYEGLIAVLTRATIRISRLRNFWRHVSFAAAPLKSSPGFILSVGIGEIPWIKQATFSIWNSKQSMKDYAYKMHQHQLIIKKTRQEDWHVEEMFIRFKIVASYGDLEMNSIIQPFL